MSNNLFLVQYICIRTHTISEEKQNINNKLYIYHSVTLKNTPVHCLLSPPW